MKNGKREGSTELAHKLSPDFAAIKLFLENAKSRIVNKQIKPGKNIFFKLKINNFIMNYMKLQTKICQW